MVRLNIKNPTLQIKGNNHPCSDEYCLQCKRLETCKIILPYNETISRYQDRESYNRLKKEEMLSYKNYQLNFINSKKEQENYLKPLFQETKINKIEINNTKLLLTHTKAIGYQIIQITENKTNTIRINSLYNPEQILTEKTQKTYKTINTIIKNNYTGKYPENLTKKILEKLKETTQLRKKEKETIKLKLKQYYQITLKETIKLAKENARTADKKYRKYKEKEEKYKRKIKEKENKLRKEQIKKLKKIRGK